MNLTDAKLIAVAEMEKWKLDKMGYHFGWHSSYKTLGKCSYKKRIISLSKSLTLANSKDQMLDTIRHEIAHALAGPYAGHGAVWKAYCLRVGCKPEQYARYDETVRPRGKFNYYCERCEIHVPSTRQWKKRKGCSACCKITGIFAEMVLDNDRTVPTEPRVPGRPSRGPIAPPRGDPGHPVPWMAIPPRWFAPGEGLDEVSRPGGYIDIEVPWPRGVIKPLFWDKVPTEYLPVNNVRPTNIHIEWIEPDAQVRPLFNTGPADQISDEQASYDKMRDDITAWMAHVFGAEKSEKFRAMVEGRYEHTWEASDE